MKIKLLNLHLIWHNWVIFLFNVCSLINFIWALLLVVFRQVTYMFYCQIRTTRTFWSWPVFGVYLICTHLANALFHMDFNLKISWMLEIKLCKSVCNKWLKVCLNNFRYTEVILLQAYGNLRLKQILLWGLWVPNVLEDSFCFKWMKKRPELLLSNPWDFWNYSS